MAMMWSALFAARSPLRFNRCRVTLPDEALAPALLAAYPQMRAILTRLDGTSMTFTQSR